MTDNTIWLMAICAFGMLLVIYGLTYVDWTPKILAPPIAPGPSPIPRVAPAPASDPLSALRPQMVPPKLSPEPLRPHLFEVIAQAPRENATLASWDVNDVTYSGQPIGKWRITVAKVDD